MDREQWLNDQHNELVERLSAGSERRMVQQELAERLKALFPDMESHKGFAWLAVSRALETIRSGGSTTTIIINNSFNRSESAPDPNIPHGRKPKIRKLNFRLIKDPSLKLIDRIVYSFLWKWAWMNSKPKRFVPKPVTDRRLRRATGSNANTIKASLRRLRDKGYIDERHEPYTKDARLMRNVSGGCMYRKLQWEDRSGMSLGESVVRAFRDHDIARRRRVGAAYYNAALGISKATFHRYEGKRRRQEGGGSV